MFLSYKLVGACNDAQYLADYGMVFRSILQQKTSFVCFRACSDQIVSVHTTYVITKADSFGKQAYERVSCKYLESFLVGLSILY